MRSVRKALEFCMKKISFREYRKRKLVGYLATRKKYELMSDDEFEMEYVYTAVKYEHMKSVLSVVGITIIISLFMDIWSYAFKVIRSTLEVMNNSTIMDDIMLAQVTNRVFWMVALSVGVLVILTIGNIMYKIYQLNRKKHIMEITKKKRAKKEKNADK